ncbi:MAG TPA: Uma2 family endonuclease [Polyangiales bacterium]
MSQPASKLATYADLRALPPDVRAEILSGQIITSPAPLPKHSHVQGAARSFIGRPFQDDDGRGGPGGWWIFVEVDVAFGPHEVVRPDLAGWRQERLPRPGSVRPIEVVPDWACEVISPSSAARDRVRKRNLYAQVGIPYYWLIDPEARLLEALILRDGMWVEAGVYGDDSTARIPPFEAIELEVGRLFLPREADDAQPTGE